MGCVKERRDSHGSGSDTSRGRAVSSTFIYVANLRANSEKLLGQAMLAESLETIGFVWQPTIGGGHRRHKTGNT